MTLVLNIVIRTQTCERISIWKRLEKFLQNKNSAVFRGIICPYLISVLVQTKRPHSGFSKSPTLITSFMNRNKALKMWFLVLTVARLYSSIYSPRILLQTGNRLLCALREHIISKSAICWTSCSPEVKPRPLLMPPLLLSVLKMQIIR